MSMTDTLGTCDNAQNTTPHVRCNQCINWTPVTNRVEIWRYKRRTLTVARSDGSCYNAPDSMLRGARGETKLEGVWNSKQMKFMSSDRFTDGTPVALYEGLEPLSVKEALIWQD